MSRWLHSVMSGTISKPDAGLDPRVPGPDGLLKQQSQLHGVQQSLLEGVNLLDLSEAVAIVEDTRSPGELRVQRSLEHRHGVALVALIGNLQTTLDSFRGSLDERDLLVAALLDAD